MYLFLQVQVLDDCLRVCDRPQNIFLRLFVWTYDKVVSQWSVDNLVHSRPKIEKEICKVMLTANEQIKVQYLTKCPPLLQKQISTLYLPITKSYILITPSPSNSPSPITIHSPHPTYLLLTSIFTSPNPYQSQLLKSFPNKGTPEEVVHHLQAELHRGIIYALERQELVWLGWMLWYWGLYEGVVGGRDGQGQGQGRELRNLIGFLMDSPLGFVDTLRHQIGVAKVLSSRSSSTTLELQILNILQKVDIQIKSHIKKQQHIYPETVLFFQAVNRNLQLILQHPQHPPHNIQPILQKISQLLKHLQQSFSQICFVLKGHLLNQIVRIDNIFGKDGTGQVISNTVTYDIFLRKYKDLPERVLNIRSQVDRLRRAVQRSDAEIQELVLAKYVQRYQLYQMVYGFYWELLCGKKLTYPMGKFVTILRNLAISFDSTQNPPSPRSVSPAFPSISSFPSSSSSSSSPSCNLQQTKTDGMLIYQKSSDSNSQHIFYSLIPSNLDDHHIHTYKTIKHVFQEVFVAGVDSDRVLGGGDRVVHKLTYVISHSSKPLLASTASTTPNKSKVHLDIIHSPPLPPQSLYTLIHQCLHEKMQKMQQLGFGVIGIYDGNKMLMDQSQVFPWTQCQARFDVRFLKFFGKKKLIGRELIAKLVKMCVAGNSEIVVRVVFWVNGVLKSCEISVNFYVNKKWVIDLAHTYKYRVFTKHEDIARWCNYNNLKELITNNKKIESEQNHKRSSIRSQYLSNHIDMIEFISQDTQQPLSLTTIRCYSPFYSQLQQVLGLLQSIFLLLQYTKSDNTLKFQLTSLSSTISLLEYYLFDKCLRSDRYIYSQGVSVTVINLVARINRYLAEHPDNNGEEKQLIYLQKVVVRIVGCVGFGLTGCAFGVGEAVRGLGVGVEKLGKERLDG